MLASLAQKEEEREHNYYYYYHYYYYYYSLVLNTNIFYSQRTGMSGIDISIVAAYRNPIVAAVAAYLDLSIIHTNNKHTNRLVTFNQLICIIHKTHIRYPPCTRITFIYGSKSVDQYLGTKLHKKSTRTADPNPSITDGSKQHTKQIHTIHSYIFTPQKLMHRKQFMHREQSNNPPTLQSHPKRSDIMIVYHRDTTLLVIISCLLGRTTEILTHIVIISEILTP
eukprot:253466_1